MVNRILSEYQPVSFVQPADKLVYLVTSDTEIGVYLSQQINHFGYYVQQVKDFMSLSNVPTDHHAVAIIVDINCYQSKDHGENIFDQVKKYQTLSSPLIFISDDDDQEVRLKSIQAGGSSFFAKPIDIVNLIDQLDSLNSNAKVPQQPYRVLIVENQQSVASYYKMVLEVAGMDAQFVINAREVLNHVREYRPDLILMETFVSGMKGTDLAKVIRQINDFVSIPILFLSSEDDFSRRMEALDLGGDDYLIKPIRASHLVAVTRSRLERLKILRSYMVHDSLTNLLNHTTFRSTLAHEVNRFKRQNGKMALAMVDIDNFKQVNDTYGHSAGDSVIKSLSRLLKQRLRRSDVVGRYGGDEFVALLLDCEAEKAKMIMEEIRIHFSEIQFYPTETKALSVTFSCGISTFPEFQSAQALSDAADQALYGAKASGRNRITIVRR
jgi:diguanylate cyclase (GGDEF)-like protein